MAEPPCSFAAGRWDNRHVPFYRAFPIVFFLPEGPLFVKRLAPRGSPEKPLPITTDGGLLTATRRLSCAAAADAIVTFQIFCWNWRRLRHQPCGVGGGAANRTIQAAFVPTGKPNRRYDVSGSGANGSTGRSEGAAGHKKAFLKFWIGFLFSESRTAYLLFQKKKAVLAHRRAAEK